MWIVFTFDHWLLIGVQRLAAALETAEAAACHQTHKRSPSQAQAEAQPLELQTKVHEDFIIMKKAPTGSTGTFTFKTIEHSVLNLKELAGAFNQKKAPVGAVTVILKSLQSQKGRWKLYQLHNTIKDIIAVT